jgi:hypothetical protein
MISSRAISICWIILSGVAASFAKEGDGHSQSPLHAWFEGLQSGKGRCCADADGDVVKDADWEVKRGHYRVFMLREWVDVPDDALITVPNLDGRTIVWPIWIDGRPQVRCFMPGSMT